MGYGYYLLPDGREAGYGVEAECDHPGCEKRIDRGLGYLCGREPLGWNDFDAPGCGNYYCGQHEFTHECANPACEMWSEDGERDLRDSARPRRRPPRLQRRHLLQEGQPNEQ